MISDLDSWIENLYACKPLTEQEVKILTEKAKEVLMEESRSIVYLLEINDLKINGK